MSMRDDTSGWNSPYAVDRNLAPMYAQRRIVPMILESISDYIDEYRSELQLRNVEVETDDLIRAMEEFAKQIRGNFG